MKNIYEQHFPEELTGLDIDGIDVQMLALDALRLLSYFARESDFTDEQYRVIREIESDLPVVIKGLDGSHRRYFEALQKSVHETLHLHHHTKGKDR